MNIILISITFFMFGTIIGSFLSVLTSRLINNTPGIWFGRSQCHNPKCRHTLPYKYMIPILSYLWLQGECTYCKSKIPIRYIILEILTGIVFVLVGFHYFFIHPTNIFILTLYLISISIAIAISLIDIETQEIHFKLSIPLGICGLLISIFAFQNSWIDILWGGFIGFSFFYMQYFISKGKWVGLGDADLGLIIGITFGPLLTVQTLFLSYILGSIVGIYLLTTHKFKLKTQLPFAPFLMFSFILNLVYNEFIQNILFPYI